MTQLQRVANYSALTPLDFLHRAARFISDRTAVIYGDQQFTYGQFHYRVGKLASALKDAGIKPGDCVAVMAPNTPAMLEAHYAIPRIGAIINPLNLKFDAAAIGYCLQHANIRCVICDQQYLHTMLEALSDAGSTVLVVTIRDSNAEGSISNDVLAYEEFIRSSESTVLEQTLEDESQPLSLLYTSGTTAKPKAVTYVHRGAYLAAMSNALSFGLNHNSVYLWTWPMFHSHGLSFVWAVTAVGGTHVCLRDVKPARVYELIGLHQVSHFCVAPTIMNTLATSEAAKQYATEESKTDRSSVQCIVGGAAPASASISRLEKLGIEVVHQYGNTECYGPVTVCWRQHSWEAMTVAERYSMMAKQGSPTPGVADLRVADMDSFEPVPMDGNTIGEVQVRGNTVMQGYYADDDATDATMVDGWLRTGDIATWHPDGSIEIKDRSVDLIISDGELISSVEVDEVLYQHPDVLEAAVVAKPDPVLGDVPYAFVTLRDGCTPDADALTNFCNNLLPAYKIPRAFEFCQLPRTATGKIKKSELREQAANS